MLKEMMYKIFPKLLAKAISDEQEHNQKQQEKIDELQAYDDRLRNNLSVFISQKQLVLTMGSATDVIEPFTATEEGVYYVEISGKFTIEGSGVIVLHTRKNGGGGLVNTKYVNSSLHSEVYNTLTTLMVLKPGDIVTIKATAINLTSCTSIGGVTGATIQRLN